MQPLELMITNFMLIATISWWNHDMDTYTTLLAICVKNPLIPQLKGQPVWQNFDFVVAGLIIF